MFGPILLQIVKSILPPMMWSGNDKNSVYLTFDDGPTPEVTPIVLAILERYGVKATFFCLGKNVDLYPELYEMILEAGHKTANHSYNHLKGWDVSLEEYVTDVESAARRIESTLFRPPYGRITKRQAKVLSRRFTLVMGDVVSQDYDVLLSPVECLGNVTRLVKGGSIVVFHDSVKSSRNMSYALPRAIEYVKSKGLGFKILDSNDAVRVDNLRPELGAVLK